MTSEQFQPHAGCLWLIGGTSDSAAIALGLAAAAIPSVITMTTAAAQSLYPVDPQLNLWVGQLTAATLPPFLQTYGISAILDASHPYATAISQLAIAMAQRYDLPYLRYERAAIAPLGNQISVNQVSVPSVQALVASSHLHEQRVLLTIGYRYLPQFQSLQAHCQLYSRIMPSAIALQTALAAGFTPDRLIALRPPVPAALERALWQHWQITTVVTKASGTPGGEAVKQAIAAALGLTLITIERPAIAYPQQTSDLATAIAFARDRSNSHSPLEGLNPL